MLFGPGSGGLLLATPLTVCLGVLGNYVPHLAFLEVLLRDEEVTELNRYYQRLVARDQDGAVEVVEELLQTQTLPDVYDAVLLPALYFTAQDQKRDNLTIEEARCMYQATSELVDNLGASQAATAVVAVPVAPEEDTAAALPWWSRPLQRLSVLGWYHPWASPRRAISVNGFAGQVSRPPDRYRVLGWPER